MSSQTYRRTLAAILGALLLGLPTGALAVAPANDDVLNAIALTVDVPFVFSNVDATPQGGEPDPGAGTGPGATCNTQDGWCGFGGEPVIDNSVWFTFEAPATPVIIHAGPADLQAALWEVGDPSDFLSFTEIAANDDSGPVFASLIAPLLAPDDLVPGTTYYIQIDGFLGAQVAGQTILVESYIPPPPLPNDDVLDAIPLTLNVPEIFSNSSGDPFSGNATPQPGEPSPGGGSGVSSCDSQDGWCFFETNVDNSVWFTFEAPSSPVTIATFGANVDLQLALWEVGDPADFSTFTEVAANDDGGPVLWEPLITPISLVPHTTYYVQVDGFAGAAAIDETILVSTDPPACPCFDATGPPPVICYDNHAPSTNVFAHVPFPASFKQVTNSWCRANALFKWISPAERAACADDLHSLCGLSPF